MDGNRRAIEKLLAEIESVSAKVDKVEEDVEAARAAQNQAEVDVLRRKEELLRRKEERLRDEMLLLLQREQGMFGLLWEVADVFLTITSFVYRAGTSGEVLSLLRRLNESQREMQESQREMKQVVTVFSAAALDLWAGCSTTDTERDRFRDTVIANYEVTAPGGLRCMVSGCVAEQSALRAAHIWPARARDSLASLFSLTLADLDSYRNGILMMASLEQQFDRQRVAFSYDLLHDKFIFHVLDRRLNRETVRGTTVTFGSLESRELLHPPGMVPFRRLLVWHYAGALRKAKSSGWLNDDELAALPRVPPKEQLQLHSPGAEMPNEYALSLIHI